MSLLPRSRRHSIVMGCHGVNNNNKWNNDKMASSNLVNENVSVSCFAYLGFPLYLYVIF